MCKTCTITTENQDTNGGNDMHTTVTVYHYQQPFGTKKDLSAKFKSAIHYDANLPALVPIHHNTQNYLPLSPPDSIEDSSPTHTRLLASMPSVTPVTRESKKRKRGRTRSSGPSRLPCSVCGDSAP